MQFDTDSIPALLKIIEIGTELSAEKNHARLLERILDEAQTISNADGGTLYIKNEKNELAFTIMHTRSLGIVMGGTSPEPIPFAPIPLIDPATGKPNYSTQSAFCALTGRPVNIPDVYDAEGFDFNGTRAFDTASGYRSRSVLTIPMKSHEDEVIGVLQLVNAQDAQGNIIPFSRDVQQIVQSLASQAAVAINNQQLIQGQKELLEAFIRVIANAIDEKSPYTGKHCSRIPIIVEMLAEAACQASEGPFRDFTMTEEEKYELRIAAWLHDCGKVTTPVHVMDKATKLETIFDRIELVATRAELLKRDAEISFLKQCLQPGIDVTALKAALESQIAEIDEAVAFLRKANIGSEYMADAMLDQVRDLAGWQVEVDGVRQNFLTENEVYNLSIRRGTLNAEERKIINDHIVVTINMLEQLPFPKNLRRVPEYAGGHHEKMDGTGYPKGLKGHEMSLPARMMAVADVFEALTSNDRPYKKPKPLSETFAIMSKMKQTHHLDPDIVDLLVTSGVYQRFAEEFLDEEQKDDFDAEAVLTARPYD